MLREAGAVEVHVRISSPPVKWPCFYGIDFASKAELIAAGLDDDQIRRSIGADSLGYVALDGLIAASEQPRSRLCRACFDGEYPIPLPEPGLVGKHVLEGIGHRVAIESGSLDGSGDERGVAGDAAPTRSSGYGGVRPGPGTGTKPRATRRAWAPPRARPRGGRGARRPGSRGRPEPAPVRRCRRTRPP